MKHSAALLTVTIVLAAVGVIHAGGQTHGRTGIAVGRIRQVPAADPAYARSLASIRYEPGRDVSATPLERDRRHRSDGVVWWPWSPILPLGGVGSDVGVNAIPPDAGPAGGLQLDVQPWRAQVFVDGLYEGRAEDFRGYYQHLALSPGLHVIAVVADDYEPLVLEILTSPGQTMTYRGNLTYVSR
jgi:hypothetical protein